MAAHQTLRLASLDDSDFAALHAGRISPEPYQFAPLAQLLKLPRPCLLIADDVGLGKTIEAGICMVELMMGGLLDFRFNPILTHSRRIQGSPRATVFWFGCRKGCCC